MAVRLRNLAPLLAVAAFLALAGTAQGATFTIDNVTNADDFTVGDGICDADGTADVDCTLKAAVQEANVTAAADTIQLKQSNSGSDPDDIAFVAGTASGLVTLSGAPPVITHPLTFNGGNCSDDAQNPIEPCAVVPTGWIVHADGEVAINGLVFAGPGTAIEVQQVNGTTAAPDFSLGNTWFGVDMNVNKVAPPQVDVQLEDVDGAAIGDAATGGNLFARQNTAIDILGADDTSIQANRIGVMPDGSSSRAGEGAATNLDGIEITGDSAPNPDDPAQGTLVGRSSAADAQTPACDGGCNLIAAAGKSPGSTQQNADGIDLAGEPADGEIPADGAVIRGNQVGFSGGGLGINGHNTIGIEVGDADNVQIGGPTAGGADRNVLNGNEITSAAGSGGLLIEGNYIGLSPDGTGSGADGSSIMLSLAGSGVVRDNFILSTGGLPAVMLSGTTGGGFDLLGNVFGENVAGNALAVGTPVISVPGSGHRIGGPDLGDGNLISDVTAAPNVPSTGIDVTGDGNQVLGNTLGLGSGGQPRPIDDGIRLSGDADDNVIGGSSATSENVIANAEGIPVVIEGAGSDGNHVLRNRGAANAGPFIDLGGDGPGNQPDPAGPNAGAQAPAITAVTSTSAMGTAPSNSVLLLFSKETPDPGEIDGFVVQVTADAAGTWQAEFPHRDAGSFLAATATSGADTSELSVPAEVPADPPVPDTDPPETRIDKAPKDRLKAKRKAKAVYAFSADEASTFLCTVDRRAEAPCGSPLKLKRLKRGRHSFSVVAVDASGNRDQSPASDSFKVKRKRR